MAYKTFHFCPTLSSGSLRYSMEVEKRAKHHEKLYKAQETITQIYLEREKKERQKERKKFKSKVLKWFFAQLALE